MVMKMEIFNNDKKERLPLIGSLEGVDSEEESRCISFSRLLRKLKNFWNVVQDVSWKAWEMGRTDPRKIIFAMKMGLALSLVSLLIFWKESPHGGQYSIWAILSVIVLFEFSIGATFIKGFNRGLGTVCAGILAFGFAELSVLAGPCEEVVIVISFFIAGFFTSYLKLYPTMAPYEYGFRVFIMTYCILMLAGNRTREYNQAILIRLVLIAAGGGVCFIVNICFYPIWAGEDLHSLVVKNFKGVAASLEGLVGKSVCFLLGLFLLSSCLGCVNGYIKCVQYERTSQEIHTHQGSDDSLFNGYRSVVESTSREANLLGFAIWEPPHGRYRMFNYPWKNYVTLSGALRHCAYMVMALHGCILSEIQAPAERRLVFQSELQRVGAEGAKALRELANKVEKMEKLSSGDILKEVHEAAEQLQKKIDQRSYLLVNSESWFIGRLKKVEDPENNIEDKLGSKSLSETVLEIRSSFPVWQPSGDVLIRKQSPWPSRLSLIADAVFREDEVRTYESASALSLATFASLLIEFVARLQNVVDSFQELSEKAEFRNLR